MNYRTMCLDCVHFEGADPDLDQTYPTCAAFPAGIPDEILRQGFDHRQEFPGDNGIRFEPDADADMDVVERVSRS